MARTRKKTAKQTTRPTLRVEALEQRELFAVGLDPTFNYGWGITGTDFGGTNDYLKDMNVQPDGKVLLVGSSHLVSGESNFAIARFESNGTLDTSFGEDGGGHTVTDFAGGDDLPSFSILQDDGKVLVVGRSQTDEGVFVVAIARYHANGLLDATFGDSGKATYDVAGGSQMNPKVGFIADDKLIVFGNSTSNSFPKSTLMVRFNLSDGSIDGSFGSGGIKVLNASMDVYSAVAHVGGYVLGGISADGTLEGRGMIAKLTGNGNIDTSFGTNGIAVLPGQWQSGWITGVTVVGNDKIVAVGNGETNGNDKVFVARWLANGALDPTFNLDGVYDSDGEHATLSGVTASLNGTVVAVGSVMKSDSIHSQDFLALRLTESGTPDPTFGVDGRVTIAMTNKQDTAKSIHSYANGNLLIGGTSLSGADYDLSLARLKNNIKVAVPHSGVGGLRLDSWPFTREDHPILDLFTQLDPVAASYRPLLWFPTPSVTQQRTRPSLHGRDNRRSLADARDVFFENESSLLIACSDGVTDAVVPTTRGIRRINHR
ncbi:MAG: delta-60 repeat domain-containing protein [Pirellulaceae bacterium]|nr:hypothetical protein [Planctomycetales bacterium]